MNIPEQIDSEELLVRNIFYPFGYKKKLQANAFQPPFNSNEISVLRYKYTTFNFCKQVAKLQEEVPEKRFCGFAVIEVSKVKLIHELDVKASPIKAHIKLRGKTIKHIINKLPEEQRASMSESLAQDFENIEKLDQAITELIDEDKQLVMDSYISIPDLPMHADILYPVLRERDVPLPVSISKPMKELTREARDYIDPEPNSDQWTGEIIT